MEKAVRDIKNSVFKTYLSEPAKALDIYNALKGTNYTDETEIEISTIQTPVFTGVKNDLSFNIKDSCIVLIEHQSTKCENMPLRCFFYLAALYTARYMGNKEEQKLLYKKELINVLTPEFYVLYNGNEEEPLERIMRLSDAFVDRQNPFHLELNVHMLNINYNTAQPLLKRSRYLREYSQFIAKFKQYLRAYKDHSTAVRKAVDYCKSHNIMNDYFEKYGKEVFNMMEFEYNWDDEKEVIAAESLEKGKLEIALEMLKEKYPCKEIVKLTKLSLERVQKLAKEHNLVCL